jgi:hypothetical protein
MLGAKPTVFVSHSEKFKETVALPFRDHAEALGMNVILVSEMPTPEHGGGEPDAKVDYYLDRADMFVALMTPDDRTESGEIHARPNVTDEITRARMRSHLRPRVQVFKASDVDLHSNINPTYEALNPDDVTSIFPIFERQAQAWEILAPGGPAEPQPAVGPIGPSDPGGRDPKDTSKGALGQAVDAVEGLKASLLGQAATGQTDSPSVVARTHLSASVALAAERSTSPFGVHELNGLFRERRLLDLTRDEERFLLRTILLHFGNNNAPGWYWFRRRSAGSLHRLIIGFALADPDESVRTRSLRMLASTPRKMDRRDLKDLVESGLGPNEEQSVQDAALDLLAKRGDTRLLRELGDVIDTPRANEAVLLVRARNVPVAGLRELLKQPSMHSSEVEEALLLHARRLPASLLRQGLHSDYGDIRRLSMRALDRSSRFRKEDALWLIGEDLSARERMDAFRIALRRGWTLDRSQLEVAIKDAGLLFNEANELWIEFQSRRTKAELIEDLTWIGRATWSVYAGLALAHFEEFADQLRKDLDSEFESLRYEYRRGVEASIRSSVEQKLRNLPTQEGGAEMLDTRVKEEVSEFFDDFDSLESFTIKKFQFAALRALAVHGDEADAVYARQFIADGDRDITKECVRLLARVGRPEDAGILVEAAKHLYQEDAIGAAEAALAVSDNSLDTISALIDTGTSRLIKVAVSGLAEVPVDEATRIIVPLLRSDIAGVRRACVGHLVRRLDREQQRKLIDLYIENGGYYYYNVVAYIDRRLHAPSWLRAASKETE